ncbi:50S ribosomal protein L18 [Clostridia bacterium]|nr:50S ribosomal protein L18 [Clostridia bacterium]
MVKQFDSNKARIKRHLRVRSKVSGTAARPRLNVFRSAKHIYAQIIDDVNGITIVSANSLQKGITENGGNVDGAKAVGTAVAKLAIEKNIKEVVFDRGGYLYHGRVKALADAARESGLEF